MQRDISIIDLCVFFKLNTSVTNTNNVRLIAVVVWTGGQCLQGITPRWFKKIDLNISVTILCSEYRKLASRLRKTHYHVTC